MEPSYASGTSSTPLLGDTIGDNLDRTIERFPDREALVSVHQDLRYTYAQFGEAVDRCARAFIAADEHHLLEADEVVTHVGDHLHVVARLERGGGDEQLDGGLVEHVGEL